MNIIDKSYVANNDRPWNAQINKVILRPKELGVKLHVSLACEYVPEFYGPLGDLTQCTKAAIDTDRLQSGYYGRLQTYNRYFILIPNKRS